MEAVVKMSFRKWIFVLIFINKIRSVEGIIVLKNELVHNLKDA